MQERLAELTSKATKDESKEEQESILQKSFTMWQTMKQAGPHFIKETIKNPKKQFSNLQEQIQDQFENLGEEISEKILLINGEKLPEPTITSSKKVSIL